MYIYKIYNDINDKLYIGITHDLNSRWLSHLRCKKKYPLYEDIRKYGKDKFHISIIEEVKSREEAKQKEIEYIRKYKSLYYQNGYNLSTGGENNACEDNPKSKLSASDIEYIRSIYERRTTTPKSLWNKEFKDRISWSAFQKIWEGTTWKEIRMDVYTDDSRNYYSSRRQNDGEDNGNSILKDSEVLNMRMYYTEHTLKDTYKKFGESFKNIDSFRMCLNYSYSNIPIYHKSKNYWTLGYSIISIEDYLNPVSTISESGE